MSSANNIIDRTYYFFVWGSMHEDIKDLVRAVENKLVDRVILFSPEEQSIHDLFQTKYHFKFFESWCKSHNIKLDFITNGNVHTASESIHKWDTFFAHQVFSVSIFKEFGPYGHNEKLLKHFTSLNGRAHPWRCMFMDYMYKEGLFPKGFISFHNLENWPINSDQHYIFRWWKPQILNIDPKWDNPPDGFRDHLVPPIQWKSSLFSFISESNVNTLFVTEKTYMPIFHKRPFLIYGPAGIHTHLLSKGFKLHDNLIDYSFDSEPDDEKRCEMVVKEMKKICEYDIPVLREMVQPQVDYNFQHLINMVGNSKSVSKTVRKILNDFEKPEHSNSCQNQLYHYKTMLNIIHSEAFELYRQKWKF